MAAFLKIWKPTSRSLSLLSRSLQTSATCPQMAAVNEVELRNARPFKEVPGPPVYPIVGCLPSMILDPTFDRKAAQNFYANQMKTYGPVVRMVIPGLPPMVLVNEPDDVEKLIRSTMSDPIRPPLQSLKRVREEAVDNYFENKTGIASENGEEWWRVRSRVQTPMMKPQMVGTYLQRMDEVSLEFMDRIAALQAEHGEMPANFQNELYKWALESVGLVALNRRLGCLDPNITKDSEAMRLIETVNDLFQIVNDVEFTSTFSRFFPSPAFKKLKMKHEQFLEIADRNIRETEAALLAKDPGSEEELTLMENLLLRDGLTRKDVVTLILDMLFAGIDTTSHTIGFTLYCLARNPEAQARLQEEIDSVLGQHEGPLLPKHMAKFSYMKAVLKESLRLFPLTLGVLRELLSDTVMGGYVIPKGNIVFAATMLTAWDEKHFPRAKEFIPERWLRDRPLGDIHPFASLPFGAGTRMCIGRRIAEQEMFTFLARAMQRFNVDYKYQDIDIHTRLVSVPSEPLRFNFTERK